MSTPPASPPAHAHAGAASSPDAAAEDVDVFIHPLTPVRVTHVEVQKVRKHESYARRLKVDAPTQPLDTAFPVTHAQQQQQQAKQLTDEQLKAQIEKANSARTTTTTDDKEDKSDDEKWEDHIAVDYTRHPSIGLFTQQHVIDRQLAPLYQARTYEELALGLEKANAVSAVHKTDGAG
jgi:hypothetical protein